MNKAQRDIRRKKRVLEHAARTWASRSLKGTTCPRHAGADDPRGVARGGAWRTRSSATSPSWAMVLAPGAEQRSEAALGCQPASKFM